MSKKTSDLAARRAHAADLKKQIQALGGISGSEPGFEEANPDLMIEFYERVLATERQLNPREPGRN